MPDNTEIDNTALYESLISGAIATIGGGVSAIAAGGSLKSNKRSKGQKRQDQLLNKLIDGLEGRGPYSNLFAADEAAFQKSFVDPAKARFSNQRAPQIQQSFIQSGQQRGTGLEDTLTRAGVDLDMLLNEQYGQFQQNALGRQQDAIGQILGINPREPSNQPGIGESFLEGGVRGLLGSGSIKDILESYRNSGQPGTSSPQPRQSIDFSNPETRPAQSYINQSPAGSAPGSRSGPPRKGFSFGLGY